MRAAFLESPGTPLRVRVDDSERPTCPPGRCRVRVHACGVNRLDLLMAEGQVNTEPWPHIPGSEVCGELVDGGDLPAGLAAGQLVAIAPYLFCGQCDFCLAGEETVCLRGDILGMRSQGGYAEEVCVPARSLLPVPAGLTAIDVAALVLAAATAWHMLISKGGLRAGETVLVQAAGSGVGSAAVQIARLCGARVIATAGSEAKLDAARALGADDAINYLRDDVASEVRRLTSRRGVDVVVEHVGAETWPASVASCARNGRIVTCGATTGRIVQTDIWQLFAKQL